MFVIVVVVVVAAAAIFVGGVFVVATAVALSRSGVGVLWRCPSRC